MGSAPFLSAWWVDLALVQFEVDRDFLRPFAPPGTRPLAIQGKSLVSLVGFRFAQTRLLGIPIPFHRTFDEINLRFYVESCEALPRKGVVFVKELVPLPAVAWVARWLYNENYHCARIRREIARDKDGIPEQVSYSWNTKGSDCLLRLADLAPLEVMEPETEAHELLENYHGFVQQRNGTTMVYQVEHPPWVVSRSHSFLVQGDLVQTYGPQWGHWLGQPPVSAFYTPGSAIKVGWGRSLKG